MIRLVLSAFLSVLCLIPVQAQYQLLYSQEILMDGQKKKTGKRSGFVHVFNPAIISFSEGAEHTSISVEMVEDLVFVQSTIVGKTYPFSTKYQLRGKLYYVNPLTGEEAFFDYAKGMNWEEELHQKLKKKRHRKSLDKNLQEYTAKIGEKSMTIVVRTDITNEQQEGLFQDFFYDGFLIVEKRISDRSKRLERIVKLESIHPSDLSIQALEDKIHQNRALVLANQDLARDSVSLGERLPNIMIKNAVNESLISLQEYEGNGKYLLLDFWGTWCKPCIASIPELEAFYQEHKDQIDLVSLDYRDYNIHQVRAKIEETGMYWTQGIITDKINDILNPESFFPGIILLDDELKIVLRSHAKKGLEQAAIILDQDKSSNSNN